ncbi:hypothetical protein S245_052443, partial [Arachis hypogaea]
IQARTNPISLTHEHRCFLFYSEKRTAKKSLPYPPSPPKLHLPLLFGLLRSASALLLPLPPQGANFVTHLIILLLETGEKFVELGLTLFYVTFE